MTTQTFPTTAKARAADSVTETSVSVNRWWDWPSAVLVFLLLLTASGRLVATRWTSNLGVVMDFVILGTILGMALGHSIYHPVLCFLTALAYGILIIPWRLGALMDPGIPWDERLVSMIGRVRTIVSQILSQTDVTDSFLFILLMACLFWILSVNAGYVLTRYANAWRIILPAGLTTIVIHYYHNCPVINLRQCVNIDVHHASTYIAVYLLLSLLLVARINYIRQKRSWRDRHTFIHSDVGFDLMRVTAVTVVVLMVVSWTAPAFGNKLFQNGGPLRTINNSISHASKFFSHVFASLSYSVNPNTEFFSQGLTLGRGSEISYAMVMQVDAPQPSQNGGNYYWLGRIYNRYQNGGWTSNYPFTTDVKAQDPILTSAFIKGRQISTFGFYTYKDLSLLFFPNQVVSVSRPVIVHMVREPDGTPDISMLELQTQMYAGERYQALSAISTYTVKELRAAGTNYPNWVTQQYLQVPSEITQRTRDLAKQITTGMTNTYDIAEAVTVYLRTNITYSRVIPPLPANQEPIDWFLFDLKQGFCNYYATAEVIMLRSLGVPARLAVGFAQGDVVAQGTPGLPPDIRQAFGPQIYQVRDKDSHAWPQVYFPDIGWINFEPTSSIREIVRPSGEAQPTAAPAVGSQAPQEFNRPTPSMDEPTPAPLSRNTNRNIPGILTTRGIIITLCIVIGLLDLAIMFWRIPLARRMQVYLKRWGIRSPEFIDRWAEDEIQPFSARLEAGLHRVGIQPPKFLQQWSAYARLTQVGRAYIEINQALHRLGSRPTPDATPAERARILTDLVPKTDAPVKILLSEYQRGMYSSHPADSKKAQVASREVRKLSYLAVIGRWFGRLERPFQRRASKTG